MTSTWVGPPPAESPRGAGRGVEGASAPKSAELCLPPALHSSWASLLPETDVGADVSRLQVSPLFKPVVGLGSPRRGEEMGPHLQREVGPLHGLSHPSSRCSPWASTGCLQARSHSRHLWCRFLTPRHLPCHFARPPVSCFFAFSGHLVISVTGPSFVRQWSHEVITACGSAASHLPTPGPAGLLSRPGRGQAAQVKLCCVLFSVGRGRDSACTPSVRG